MKLTKTFTISLATVVFAATIGVGAAYAAEQSAPTYYPDSFECSLSFESGLVDYAVYGDSYAFAYNGQLAVLKGNGNNERLPDINAVPSITQLEYSDDGKLFVCFADGYCVYPDLDNKLPLSQISVQDSEQWQVSLGDVSYSLNNADGSMLYMSKSGFEAVTLQDTYEGEIKFSKLKKYDNSAYAVMNNSLYRLEGAVAVKVEPTYYGYIDKTKAIPTGTAAEALKAEQPITCGWVEKGKYYTEISLENVLGATFEVPDPSTATKLSEDRLYCLILAESGNAYIISMGGKCYLTAKTSVSAEAESPALSTPDVSAAYAVERIGVYSRPYLSAATKLCELDSGSSNAVTVLGQFTDLVGREFYKIEYVDGEGTKITGYAAKGLMTGYAFPAEDEEVHPDGGDSEFIYDTNVVTVALAVAIVALVIIAVLYVAAASSKKSKKKKKKQQKKAVKERRRNEDEDDDYDEDDYE
ncbi:MAG: hypothetical protein ACI4QN_00615 [Candidatus Coproplasma sp.]